MGKGDVIIGIDLEIDGLKESREVTKTFTELTKDVKSTDAELSALEKQGQKWAKTLTEIRRKSSKGVATKEYLDLRDIVNGLESDTKRYSTELDNLNTKLSKADPKSDRYKKLQEEISKTGEKLRKARSDYAEFKAFFEEFSKTTEAYKPFDASQIEEWNGEATKAVSKLKDVNVQIQQIKDSRAEDKRIIDNPSLEESKQKIDQVGFAIEDLANKTNPLLTGVGNVSEAFKNLKEDSGFKITEEDLKQLITTLNSLDLTKSGFGGFQPQVDELSKSLEQLKGVIPEEDFKRLSDRLKVVTGDINATKTLTQSFFEDFGTFEKLSEPLQTVINKYGELQELLEKRRHINYDELVKSGDTKGIQEYNELTGAIKNTYQELNNYVELKNVDINTNEADADSILKMEQELSRLKKVRDALKGSKFATDEQSQEYAKAIVDIERLELATRQYYANVRDAVRKGSTSVKESVKPINAFGQALKSQLVTAAEKAKKSLISLGNSAKKSVGNLFSKLASSLKSVAGNFRKSSGGADELNKKLKHGWTAIMKYVLGFRSLFFLVRKLRGAVKEGLENLVQFEGGANETNKQITALQSSLLFLKNAWAAAFAPIINVVVPILNVIIDKIAQLGNLIASFIASLTGQATVIHAVKTEVEDYAKSLDKSAGSSGKASKAADKLKDRLAAFDDLNVLGKDDETDPNKSGGGGGGGDLDIPNINDMFKRVLTQSTFADMIKKAMETWDFSSVGDLFAQKFVNLINKIKWTDVQNKLSDGLKGITSFINGFFTNPQLFTSIGYNLAQGFNTVFVALKEFIDGIDWYNIFHNVGSGINTFLDTFNFDNVVELIKSGAKALVEAFSGLKDGLNIDFSTISDNISNFATTILDKWAELNESGAFEDLGNTIAGILATAIEGVPLDTIETAFSNLVTTITTFLNGAFGNEDMASGIGEFIAGAFNSAADILDTFIGKAELNNFAKSLALIVSKAITGMNFTTILGTLKTLVKKLFSMLTTLFMKADWIGIGNALGSIVANIVLFISDPENVNMILAGIIKVVFAIMVALVQVIIGAIAGIFGTIVDTVVNALSELDLYDKCVEIISNMLDGIEDDDSIFEIGVQVVKGLFSGMLEALKGLGTWLKDNFVDPFVDAVKELFGIASPSKVMEEIGGYLIDGLLLGLENLVTLVSQPFIDLKDKVEEIWNSIKEKAVTLWTALKLKLYTLAIGIKNLVTTPFTDIKDAIVEAVTGMKNKVISLWTILWNGIKRIINNIIGGIESFVNAIIDGINSLLSLLDVVDDLPDAVKEYVGLDDFTVPQLNHIEIPRLAQGAVIPPNKEFMAILGDQKYGTNIEAPLDTIKDAFADVVGNLQVENTGNAVMQVDGQTFARLMTPYVVSELGRRGYDVRILEG